MMTMTRVAARCTSSSRHVRSAVVARLGAGAGAGAGTRKLFGCWRSLSVAATAGAKQRQQRWLSVNASEAQVVALGDSRSVLQVDGADGAEFLQGMLTNDVVEMEDKDVRFSMLLNPKGRVLVDAFVHRISPERFYLDLPRPLIRSVADYFTRFRLRSQVEFRDVSDTVDSVVGMNVDENSLKQLTANFDVLNFQPDPRIHQTEPYCRSLWRGVCTRPSTDSDSDDNAAHDEHTYQQLRISMGFGEGPVDHQPKKSLPLQCNLDYLHGVSWTKGCYIGQELTARTHHMGMTRKRLMPITLHAPTTVAPGSKVINTETGKAVGDVRSQAGVHALAMIRLEPAKGAQLAVVPQDGDEPGDMCPVSLHWPKWWPEQ
ncbi:hypothetical protein PTSG_05939 [Salpingoeca rosetta]|uniref:Uncharacterized protein n=1 Tax=Salpingoeca rosetta (strain ATCC 50818 / BSB-021) TaxID=946362 RepID=F2UD79_SALR5|nr:uncharacterized protein PTSG_05939 [Salpingoeca rosetta]EGD74574.1 hypothetical protein PTSG_05939 [Salpingoeca rosetta]|eukprot:XP_004992831.1 hypothetical protein PTSG_05939 [Salpingoeca rosetta]